MQRRRLIVDCLQAVSAVPAASRTQLPDTMKPNQCSSDVMIENSHRQRLSLSLWI